MDLPVMPPVAPMLAKSVPTIPPGAALRAEVGRVSVDRFRDGDDVEIGSRNERPMTRYFPELVEAVHANFPQRCVIDGEIVVADLDATPWTSRRCNSASTRRPAG